jgi:hypothetical protein
MSRLTRLFDIENGKAVMMLWCGSGIMYEYLLGKGLSSGADQPLRTEPISAGFR